MDHVDPSLSLAGTLTEQATVGTKLLEYNLAYNAADGDDAAATAQTPFGVQGTGTGQLERPQGIAVDASGNIWVADSTNNRLLKYGPSGTFIKQVGSLGSGNGQFNDPRGVAVSSSGSVWVADSGNKRLQQFNGNGEFIRSVTHPEFSALWGVATAPGGIVWVVDRNARRAFKFRESDGAYLDVAGEKNPGLISLPLGIAADAYGNVWIVDHTAGKIKQYDKDGTYLTEFGTLGTGNGQLTNPVGIAVTASGNLLVTDRDNNRVQEFEVDGRYLRQFGAKGSASNQLLEPLGIATGPGGLAYIADAGNHRISRWTHADLNPQSGTAKVEIKVDGNAVKTESPGCSTKNCSIIGSWTLRADDYSAGQHTVEVVVTDAVGIAASKTLTIETHGDRTDPAIALSGPMTEQGSLGTTRPNYRLRVEATDPGPFAERKSGVASTTIKVDGVVVDSASPGCPAEGCSIVREWTLNSDSYSVGPHTVEVKAIDAAGRSTTKTLTINIARDTTAPEIETFGGLYNGPSGWLEQKLYGYTAQVSDKDGYGVTSVQLKIDGNVAKDNSYSCPQGGCGQLFGYLQKIDMNAYNGGAHPAELVATDGAGNKRKRSWTINIDPSGSISVSEATDTLEALEDTTNSSPVGPAGETEIYGTMPDLGLANSGEDLVATGTAVPGKVASDSSEGLAFQILTDGALRDSCDGEEPDDPETDTTVNQFVPEDEELESSTGSCDPSSLEGPTDLEQIEISPVAAAATAGETTLAPEGSAAIAANTANEADTVVRPLYEGGLIFQAIRTVDAPDSYSWHVELAQGQSLKLLDSQHAMVYYESGHPAFSITAEAAHDAVGTTVPTSLSVSGTDIVTLHVDHRANQGPAWAYPILAGTGWRGGFTTTEVDGPMDEQELQEERERIEREEREALEAEEEGGEAVFVQRTDLWSSVTITFEGPPVWGLQSSGPDNLDKGRNTFAKKFKVRVCYYDGEPPNFSAPLDVSDVEEMAKECKARIGWRRLEAKLAVHGWYRGNTSTQLVWIKTGNLHCSKWGEDQPAKVNCGKNPQWPVSTNNEIQVWGDYRFWPGDGPAYSQPPGGAGTSACVTVRGTIKYGEGVDAQEPIIKPARQGDPCPWPIQEQKE